MYGEYSRRYLSQASNSGSSPRVRGIPDPGWKVNNKFRFIPACTGNTHAEPAANAPPAVHPRVYGEYRKIADGAYGLHGSSPRLRGIPIGWKTLPFQNGSSPRVRGIRSEARSMMSCWRFIPACTGNTHYHMPFYLMLTVHPRVYGEYASAASRSIIHAGSSPRVRGIPYLAPYILFYLRFIPACTGNTVLTLRTYCLKPVHPRVYGEYCLPPSFAPRRDGSSPRVRGIPSIIACHGDLTGSSPRVRGIRTHVPRRRRERRFIPACTGNTALQSNRY